MRVVRGFLRLLERREEKNIMKLKRMWYFHWMIRVFCKRGALDGLLGYY